MVRWGEECRGQQEASGYQGRILGGWPTRDPDPVIGLVHSRFSGGTGEGDGEEEGERGAGEEDHTRIT